jgi:hypothetical protein
MTKAGLTVRGVQLQVEVSTSTCILLLLAIPVPKALMEAPLNSGAIKTRICISAKVTSLASRMRAVRVCS